MSAALLWSSVIALLVSLALAWAHFQGAMGREPFVNSFIALSLVYFVCATVWAYRKKS